MTEMVERVARVLCGRTGRNPDALEPGDAYGVDSVIHGEPCHFLWRHYGDDARAAIEAMRQPTDAMIDAANGEYRDDDRAALVGEWQFMIDAALAPAVME